MAIPAGEAWERNIVFSAWATEVIVVSTTVSHQFSLFVTDVFENTRNRYLWLKRNPRETLRRIGQPPEQWRAYNSRMCVLLLPAIPEDVKHRVLEDVDDSTTLTAVDIMDEVWSFVAPGGLEELE